MPIALPPQPAVVAEVVDLDAFAFDPVSNRVQILADGTVQALVGYRDGHTQKVAIGKLEAAAVTSLRSQVAELPAGDLQKVDPNATPCEDGADITYTAVNGAGAQVGLAKTDSCIDYQRPDGKDVSRIKGLLDGFWNVQPPVKPS